MGIKGREIFASACAPICEKNHQKKDSHWSEIQAHQRAMAKRS
jgi:hypothetical protein